MNNRVTVEELDNTSQLQGSSLVILSDQVLNLRNENTSLTLRVEKLEKAVIGLGKILTEMLS